MFTGSVVLILEASHGEVTHLVCLGALRDVIQEVEEAQVRCREASQALARIRESLDQAMEQAYRQQSFDPLGTLFEEEEAAVSKYEQAKAQLAWAEERWRDVGAALAYERRHMLVGPSSRYSLN